MSWQSCITHRTWREMLTLGRGRNNTPVPDPACCFDRTCVYAARFAKVLHASGRVQAIG